MSNDLTLTNLKTQIRTEPSDIDGLIKLIMATVLAVLPFFSQTPMSFGIISFFLVIVTLVSKIKPRTLLISAASYGIVVLIPYLFGFLMNSLLYWLFPHNLFTYQQGMYETVLRMLRLFLLWYISILYFQTTPMKTVIGILDKLMQPLKLIGVPVADYLKVVMCVVTELTEMGAEMKKSLGQSIRSAQGKTGKFRINVKGISQIIISLILNSFDKLDKIESYVEKVNPDDLYNYRFRLSICDVGAVLSFIVLVSVVFIIEGGAWF
jgi:Cobalt transport protein.